MRWVFQIAVLALLLLFFALQIPKSALFFHPRHPVSVRPSVAFVELGDATYARVMRQQRSTDGTRPFRNWSEGLPMDSDLGVQALEETLPLPEPLPLANGRARTPAPEGAPLQPLHPSLKPPSLAAPPLVPLRADSSRTATKVDDDLLDLESLETLKERN